MVAVDAAVLQGTPRCSLDTLVVLVSLLHRHVMLMVQAHIHAANAMLQPGSLTDASVIELQRRPY